MVSNRLMTKMSSQQPDVSTNAGASTPSSGDIIISGDISDETKKFLADLIQEQFAELKLQIQDLRSAVELKNYRIATLSDTIENLQATVGQRDKRIEKLENDVISAVKRNVVCKSDLAVLRDELEVKIYDNEQYSRKDSLRIEGIDHDANETHEVLGTKINNVLTSLGAKSSLTDFHRSSTATIGQARLAPFKTAVAFRK